MDLIDRKEWQTVKEVIRGMMEAETMEVADSLETLIIAFEPVFSIETPRSVGKDIVLQYKMRRKPWKDKKWYVVGLLPSKSFVGFYNGYDYWADRFECIEAYTDRDAMKEWIEMRRGWLADSERPYIQILEILENPPRDSNWRQNYKTKEYEEYEAERRKAKWCNNR